MKFFSIITICKDNLEELKKTHDSIKNQSCTDYKWIVIDGNSKDGTKDWLKNDKTVRWISEPDSGIYDAMNKGITKSQERFMIFMNSGDCFASDNVLEDVKSSVEFNNLPSFIYGDSIDISQDNKPYYRKAKSYKKNWLGMITQHQAMFFNREKIGNINYSTEYPLSADYAYIGSILKSNSENEILKLNFPICKFSMGGVNESKRFQAIKEDYLIRQKVIKLPLITSSFLYILHYIHAEIKRQLPSSRFIRHKSKF